MNRSSLKKVIETNRLMLRSWQAADVDRLVHLHQDPRVIEWLPGPWTLQKAQRFVAETNAHINMHGFGFWAVETKTDSIFLGFVGLNQPDFHAHFTPCVEVGWRLGSAYWGHGYATEAAAAAVQYGFETMGLQEIVSFTVPANVRSLRVMERIGMQRDVQGDFAHPRLPLDHRLSQHVLYRISQTSS